MAERRFVVHLKRYSELDCGACGVSVSSIEPVRLYDPSNVPANACAGCLAILRSVDAWEAGDEEASWRILRDYMTRS